MEFKFANAVLRLFLSLKLIHIIVMRWEQATLEDADVPFYLKAVVVHLGRCAHLFRAILFALFLPTAVALFQ